MSIPNLSDMFINQECSIREAVECIDRSGRISIALVVDDNQCLITTITDGDIRRGILSGTGMDAPVSELLPIKVKTPHPQPVTALVGTDSQMLLQLMQEQSVRQVPLLNAEGQVVDIVILSDLLPQQSLPVQAVVMAGGFGSRLRPLTDELPKPMLPIGGRPLMETIIEQLREAGIRQVNITTHYQAEKITDYFGDGRSFGVELNYVNEERPMGTAGALRMISVPEEPLLVINGDIVTKVDFRAMFGFHQKNNALMTIGVRRYEVQVPYGVLECDGPLVHGFREKPQFNLFINAGIYLLEPSVFGYIPDELRFDMTDLIQRLIDAGQPVVSFPIHEYWLDIGQHSDYARAQNDVKGSGRPDVPDFLVRDQE